MSGRIRSIKPEWLEDELMSAASSDCRVLSIAMILMADDYGNGRCHKANLAGRVFPPSCDSQEDLLRSYTRFSAALDELLRIRFAGVYQVNGQHYFAIRKWSDHQKVNHPGKPLVPSPPEDLFNSSCGSLASLCPDLRPTTNDQRPGGDGILARAHEAENQDASLPPSPPVKSPPRSRVETPIADAQPGQGQVQPPKVEHSEPPTSKPPLAGNVARNRPDPFRSSFVDSEAPDSIVFSAEQISYASDHGIDIGECWLSCRDDRRAKKLRREDWSAEFWAWLRREIKFGRGKGGAKKPKQSSAPKGSSFDAEWNAAVNGGQSGRT